MCVQKKKKTMELIILFKESIISVKYLKFFFLNFNFFKIISNKRRGREKLIMTSWWS